MKNNPELIVNAFTERFAHFLAEHGNLNPNSLAVIMAESNDPSVVKPLSVKYRRWLNAEASPSFDGLVELALKFDVDMNWFMLGIGEMKTSSIPATVAAPVPKSQAENDTLKDQVIKMLTAQLEQANRDKEDLKRSNEYLFQLAHPELFVDREHPDAVKLGSSSHTTDLALEIRRQQEVYGLVRYDQQEICAIAREPFTSIYVASENPFRPVNTNRLFA